MQLHQTPYAGSDLAVLFSVTGDGAVAQEALDCSDAVDKAQCYITPALFHTLHMLVENRQLCTFNEEEMSDWPVVKTDGLNQKCFH